MNSLHTLLALCSTAMLLAGCPASSGSGVADDGSSGIDPTAGVGPTTNALTTTADDTSVADDTTTTAAQTTSSGPAGSSSDEGPPPECVDDEGCDNGVFCDGAEGCVDGACVQSPPPDCDDGVACTLDSCDDARGTCVNEVDDGVCGCGETCDPTLGCGNHCVIAECNGQVYECGNCLDDEDVPDCQIDAHDTDCWGPCDNNESGWSGEVPGQQNQSECNVMDCYFDQNSGSGNDGCYWSHSCDPLEPTACAYDPGHNLPGTPLSCTELQMTQSMECLDYCGPLVPNGCDCFGCCDVSLEDGTSVTIYLGTADPDTDVGTCNLGTAQDPALCNPCTQVDACLNTCEACELCVGRTELPRGCEEQDCPPGLLVCGQPGQDPCPMGQACVTGCCVPSPQ